MTNDSVTWNVIYWSGLISKLEMYRYLALLYGYMNGTFDIKWVFSKHEKYRYLKKVLAACMIPQYTLTDKMFFFFSIPKLIGRLREKVFQIWGLWSRFTLILNTLIKNIRFTPYPHCLVNICDLNIKQYQAVISVNYQMVLFFNKFYSTQYISRVSSPEESQQAPHSHSSDKAFYRP